jgi:hypothetical protein
MSLNLMKGGIHETTNPFLASWRLFFVQFGHGGIKQVDGESRSE